jgi:hypothetical protein
MVEKVSVIGKKSTLTNVVATDLRNANGQVTENFFLVN